MVSVLASLKYLISTNRTGNSCCLTKMVSSVLGFLLSRNLIVVTFNPVSTVNLITLSARLTVSIKPTFQISYNQIFKSLHCLFDCHCADTKHRWAVFKFNVLHFAKFFFKLNYNCAVSVCFYFLLDPIQINETPKD